MDLGTTIALKKLTERWADDMVYRISHITTSSHRDSLYIKADNFDVMYIFGTNHKESAWIRESARNLKIRKSFIV